MCDAERGVVHAVAFEAAVAQDLPVLHPGKDVLDPGADLAVGGVVLLFPARELRLARSAAVRDEQSGVLVAAVSDHNGAAHRILGPGALPGGAVVHFARHGPAYRNDQPSVGVDDHLMVGGVPVVLGPLGDRVIARGHQGSVYDQYRVPAVARARVQRRRGCQIVDDAVGRRLRDAEERCQLAQRQVRAPAPGPPEASPRAAPAALRRCRCGAAS